ncbi:MAG: Aminotran 1 2 protein, partial [Bacteroidota bacterium]|nr:Aminotran 1 2 protein [Bacteroidota bacterium]
MNDKIAADRIGRVPDSIFATMSRLAYETQAVNLGQGFPDFDGPDWIMEQSYMAMKAGKNQYTATQGIFSLRNSVKEYHKKYYDIEWDIENEITVTAGATEALYAAITSLIQDGDEVIMFEPFYDSHHADVLMAGGIPRYVTLHKPDFWFDFDEFESQISDKTKMIILNSPHNPTGKVFTRDELEFISLLAVKHNLIVLSDEVYEFITYDGAKHIPISSMPGMRDRTITVSSSGKTFSMTGWKVGFAIANERLTDAIRKIHQWIVFAVNTPAQHAMAFAFSRPDDYLPDFRKMYEA